MGCGLGHSPPPQHKDKDGGGATERRIEANITEEFSCDETHPEPTQSVSCVPCLAR